MQTRVMTPRPTADVPVNNSSNRRRRVILGLLYVSAFALLAWLFVDGWSYYTAAYADRPHLPQYRVLRPAGSRGLIFGIVGASMMIVMFVYSLQKRWQLFGRRLPLRPFLDIHIFLGVVAPFVILLHTSFKVQGLVAIAFWSMVAVALSGYLGRYLYQQIPRNMDDQELSLGEIETSCNHLLEQIRARHDINNQTLDRIVKSFENAYALTANSLWRLIPRLIITDLRRPWIKRRLRRKVYRLRLLAPREANELIALASERALLKRRLLVLERVHRLFHWWHVIHKPFAIIMYIIMIVHIGVAVWTGYAWYR
ncbi:MAG: hypothetical protein D6800_04020 [Candidatus Zixiibacteriota bacterium]|nr:MAG: hypothetical protein D6800_04020 [candidate division Zixibacteria bacterium]